MEIVMVLLNSIFGCHHRQLSRIFTINSRSYRVCCKCGKEFAYSLENMTVRRRPRASQTAAIAASQPGTHRASTTEAVESPI